MILPYFILRAFVQPPLWEGVKVETRWLYFTVSGFPFFWATPDKAQKIRVSLHCDETHKSYAVSRFDVYLCEKW